MSGEMYEKVGKLIGGIEEILGDLYMYADGLRQEHYNFCKAVIEEQKRKGIKPTYSRLGIKIRKEAGKDVLSAVTWSYRRYMNREKGVTISKELRKDKQGHTSLIELEKLSQDWERGYVVEKEMELRKVRRRVRSLRKALLYLRRLERGLVKEEEEKKGKEGGESGAGK